MTEICNKIYEESGINPEDREIAEKFARNAVTTLRIARYAIAAVVLGGAAILVANAVKKANAKSEDNSASEQNL